MKKSKKQATKSATPRIVVSSSRGAVESAIDITKDNKTGTWEESRRRTGKIATWDDLAKNLKSSARQSEA